jgi:hypothetical protein
MMSAIDGPMTDKEWEAHEDAHSLRRAAEVSSDPKRLKKAQAALVEIEKAAEDALKAIQAAKGFPDKMYPSMPDADKDGK